MHTTRWFMVATLVVSMGVIGAHTQAGSPAQDKAKSDRELIQGTWIAVSGERNGEKLNEFQLKNWEEMIFKDDQFTREGAEKREGTYKLDPDQTPKEIDLLINGKIWPGIYELKGTALKLAFGLKDRPTEFTSKGGVLVVFKKK